MPKFFIPFILKTNHGKIEVKVDPTLPENSYYFVNKNMTCQMDSIYDYEHVTPAMAQYFSSTPPVVENRHHNHEVVENMALGKTFKYCRDCKKEVV